MKKFLIIFGLSLFTYSTQLHAVDYNKTIYKEVKKLIFKNKKTYPTKKGSILVTSDKLKNILPLGHAAIVDNKNYVYEATSKGVVRGFNNWNKTKKTVYGLEVKNVNSKQTNKVMNYVKRQVNKKYNYNFLNTKTRSKFYCSHLIWAAYYDNLKINLDTNLFGNAAKKGAIHPLELVLSNKTKVTYYHAKK